MGIYVTKKIIEKKFFKIEVGWLAEYLQISAKFSPNI